MTDAEHRYGLSAWETPRRAALIAACTAIASGGFAFWVGYDLGQRASRPLEVIVHLDAPEDAFTRAMRK